MAKELFSLAERLRLLREKAGKTQTDIAKELGLTRSSVNSWEQGFAIPSMQYIVELAKLHGVSTDYLLGLNQSKTISVEGLTDKQVGILVDLVQCFRADNL